MQSGSNSLSAKTVLFLQTKTCLGWVFSAGFVVGWVGFCCFSFNLTLYLFAFLVICNLVICFFSPLPPY